MAKQASNIPTETSEDYSPSSTLIHFPQPLPLLRGPIPASPTDDPSLGPYILTFPTQTSFFSTFNSCKSKLTNQCLSGIRIGCSISASEKCKPGFWKTLFTKPDFKARSECEEREMEKCLVGSSEKCGMFAKEKCLCVFGSARVRVGRNERKVRWKDVGRLMSLVSVSGRNDGFVEMLMGCQLSGLSLTYEVTNVRGYEILKGQN